ncbi:energy transducer TonB [Sphingobacterium sp. LRF_L2]|uniref:energy transducer TonB n=1 Tax=Sphingobacterium sp. LRF_L2 TaxID=3369421 RepID=UPI003F5DDC24
MRSVFFLFSFLLSACSPVMTQRQNNADGMTRFRKWVGENYKFTKDMKKARLKGEIVVAFTVDTIGILTDFEILKDLGFGTGEELVRVLDFSNIGFGRWRPGMQDGKPVSVRYTIPVTINAK